MPIDPRLHAGISDQKLIEGIGKQKLNITGPGWTATAKLLNLNTPGGDTERGFRPLFVDRNPRKLAGKERGLPPVTLLCACKIEKVAIDLSDLKNWPGTPLTEPLATGPTQLAAKNSVSLVTGHAGFVQLLLGAAPGEWHENRSDSPQLTCLGGTIDLQQVEGLTIEGLPNNEHQLSGLLNALALFTPTPASNGNAQAESGGFWADGSGLLLCAAARLPWQQGGQLNGWFRLGALPLFPDQGTTSKNSTAALRLDTGRMTKRERQAWNNAWKPLQDALQGEPQKRPPWLGMEIPAVLPTIAWPLSFTDTRPSRQGLLMDSSDITVLLRDADIDPKEPSSGPRTVARIGSEITKLDIDANDPSKLSLRISSGLVAADGDDDTDQQKQTLTIDSNPTAAFENKPWTVSLEFTDFPLAFDPIATPAALRLDQGLPTPEPSYVTQSSTDAEKETTAARKTKTSKMEPIDEPLVWGFMPLDDGWAQLPVPNLVETLYPFQAATDDQQQETNVLQGAVVFNSGVPTEPLNSASNPSPWALTITTATAAQANWELTVTGTGLILSKASVVLQRPEIRLNGLFWLSTGRPRPEDALPDLSNWVNALRPIALKSSGLFHYAPLARLSASLTLAPVENASQSAIPLIRDWSFRYEFDPKTLKQLEQALPPERFQKGLQRKPALLWLRHPKLPTIQALPMTQDLPANHPAASRSLAPFELPRGTKSKLPEWPFACASKQAHAVWPTYTGKLKPYSVWAKRAESLGMVLLSLPGATLLPNRENKTRKDQTLVFDLHYRHDLPYTDEIYATATLSNDKDAAPRQTITPILRRKDYDDYWGLLANKAALATIDARDAFGRHNEKTTDDRKPYSVTHLAEPYVWRATVKPDLTQYPGSISLSDASGNDPIKLLGTQALEGFSNNFSVLDAEGSSIQLDPVGPLRLTAGSMHGHFDNGLTRDQRGLQRGISRHQGKLIRTPVQLDTRTEPEQDIVQRIYQLVTLTEALATTVSAEAEGWKLWFRDLPVDPSGVFDASAVHRSSQLDDINDPDAHSLEKNYLTGYEWRFGPKDFSPDNPHGYDLHLMSVSVTEELIKEARSLVIVAFVDARLHIRIFDAVGEKVVDKTESELVAGEAFTALKRRLNLLPDDASLSQQDKQEIISKATSIAGHTQPRSELVPLTISGLWFFPLALQRVKQDAIRVTEVVFRGRLQLPLGPKEAAREQTGGSNTVWCTFSTNGTDDMLALSLVSAEWPGYESEVQRVWPLTDEASSPSDDGAPRIAWSKLNWDAGQLTIEAPELQYQLFGAERRHSNESGIVFPCPNNAPINFPAQPEQQLFLGTPILTLAADGNHQLVTQLSIRLRRTSRATTLNPEPNIYTVRKHDWLSTIAEQEYGDFRLWRRIYHANRAVIGDDPNKIYPGQKLVIPPKDDTPRDTPEYQSAPLFSADIPITLLGKTSESISVWAWGLKVELSKKENTAFKLSRDRGALQVHWTALQPTEASLLPGMPLSKAEGAPGFVALRFTPELWLRSANLEMLLPCAWGTFLTPQDTTTQNATPLPIDSKDLLQPSAGKLNCCYSARKEGQAQHWDESFLLSGMLEINSLISWPEDAQPNTDLTELTIPGTDDAALGHTRHLTQILFNQVVLPVDQLVIGARGTGQLLSLLPSMAWQFVTVLEHWLLDVSPIAGSSNWNVARGRSWSAVQEVRLFRKDYFLELLDKVGAHQANTLGTHQPIAPLDKTDCGWFNKDLSLALREELSVMADETSSRLLFVEASATFWIKRHPIMDTLSPVEVLQYLPDGVQTCRLSRPEQFTTASPSVSPSPAGAGSADTSLDEAGWLILPLPLLGRLFSPAPPPQGQPTTAPLVDTNPLIVDPIQALGDGSGTTVKKLTLKLSHRRVGQSRIIRFNPMDSGLAHSFNELNPDALNQSWLRIHNPPEEIAQSPGFIMQHFADGPGRLSRYGSLHRLFDACRGNSPPAVTSSENESQAEKLLEWRPDAFFLFAQAGGLQADRPLAGWHSVALLLQQLGAHDEPNRHSIHAVATLLPGHCAAAANRHSGPYSPQGLVVSPYSTIDFHALRSTNDRPESIFAELLCQVRGEGPLNAVATLNWSPPKNEPVDGPTHPVQQWATKTHQRLASDSPLAILRLRQVHAAGGYDLHLMSVDTADGLVGEGRSLVVVALVGADLHIGIFDASGDKVVDKAGNELISGQALTALKLRLNPLPDESSLSEEDKREIIRNATSSAGHTPASTDVLIRYGFQPVIELNIPAVLAKRAPALRTTPRQLRFREGQFGGQIIPKGLDTVQLSTPLVTDNGPLYCRRNDKGRASWPWDLSAFAARIQYTQDNDAILEPGISQKRWWQALQYRVQYQPTTSGRPSSGLPPMFRARSIHSLLPTVPGLELPKLPDEKEISGDPVSVVPGSVSIRLIGERSGSMLALRSTLLRQEWSTTVASGSVPVQHRMPRPVELPDNKEDDKNKDTKNTAIALQPWASHFEPTRNAVVSPTPSDEAYFAPSLVEYSIDSDTLDAYLANWSLNPKPNGPNAGEIRINRIVSIKAFMKEKILNKPVFGQENFLVKLKASLPSTEDASSTESNRSLILLHAKKKFNGGESGRIRLTLASPDTCEIDENWDGELTFELEVSPVIKDYGITIRALTERIGDLALTIGESSFMIKPNTSTETHVSFFLKEEGLDNARFAILKQLPGRDIVCHIPVKSIFSLESFEQTLGFQLQVRHSKLPKLPLRPTFIHFEDPEYNRKLATPTAHKTTTGRAKGQAMSHAVRFAADKREYTTSDKIVLRYDWDDEHLNGVGELKAFIVRRGVALSNDGKILSTEPKPGKILTVAVTDFYDESPARPGDKIRLGDTIRIELTATRISKNDEDTWKVSLHLQVTDTPGTPPPDAAYALLRSSREDGLNGAAVNCTRFAWGPLPVRVDMVCPTDLRTDLVRRRAVFHWQDSERSAEPSEHKIQKITVSGSTHFFDKVDPNP